MKISELAVATQTPTATIRYYEREGLLPQAPRSDGNYRIYAPEQVERLSFVRHCRALDMALNEIRVLLRFKDAPQAECGEVNALLDQHIGHVTTRIRELKRLEKDLKALRQQCDGVGDAAHCGILKDLAQSALPTAAKSSGGHVPGSHRRYRRGAGPSSHD